MNNDEELIRKNIEAHGERMAAINIAAHERSRRLLNMEDDLEMLDLCFGKYLKQPKEKKVKLLPIEKFLLGTITVLGVVAVLSMSYCNHQLRELQKQHEADYAIMQEEAARREYNLRDLLPDYTPPGE